MTGYYLGIPVEVIDDLGCWCRCRWANAKIWRHWRGQVKRSPWGREPV